MYAPDSRPRRVWPTPGRSLRTACTYTFHLNKDAKWHDGVDVTAADVQFSFDALANPDTGSVYTGTLRRLGRIVARHRR